MKEKILNGKCLYTPNGAAREYAAVGCNFYRGCPFQCKYCYNRKGITANVMGVDHAVLEKKFSDMKYRPKKYQALSGKGYAYQRFTFEVDKNVEYLRNTGIFFSFSTDPLCQDCIVLTWRAAQYAIGRDIPVKILTKNAGFTAFQMMIFDRVPQEKRHLIAFGFTLTGRDEWEPYASPNIERIRMMQIFKKMGFHTFASIEPIVDFNSSLEMISKTIRFCDQYLVGLMSKRGTELPPYDSSECASFVFDADSEVSRLNETAKVPVRIYWKNSVRKLMKDNAFAMVIINNSPVSVSRDWSLFTGKEVLV